MKYEIQKQFFAEFKYDLIFEPLQNMFLPPCFEEEMFQGMMDKETNHWIKLCTKLCSM